MQQLHTILGINPDSSDMELRIQSLNEAHREDVRRLYLRLDKASTYQRFGSSLNVESVSAYVSRLNMTEGLVIGAFDKDRLIGVCEALPFVGEDSIRELAFVVDPAYRGQHVGYLLGRALLAASDETLVVACMAENPAMNHLARKLGFTRLGSKPSSLLPEGLVEELLTPYGLFAGEGDLREAA